MGANIEIEKNGKYFRDAYNVYNVWWAVGMSYWDMYRILQKEKEIDDEGYVTPKGVKRIWDEIQKHPMTDEGLRKALDERSDSISIETFHQDMKKDYTEMVNFWKEAVELQSKVVFSV